MDGMDGLDEKSIKEKLLEKLIDDLDLFPMSGHGEMKPQVAKLEVSEMGSPDDEDPDNAEDSADPMASLKDKLMSAKMGQGKMGSMGSRFGNDDDGDEDQR